MSIFNGLNELSIGRSGNTVTYLLNGKLVKRRIGKTLVPATIPQLASRHVTSITAAFLRPLNSFIQKGFELEAKQKSSDPYSIASSYNRLSAIAGTYPDQYINLAEVLLTKGDMPATLGIAVKSDKNDLVFTWDAAASLKGQTGSDQVMLMAYIPGKESAVYLLNAAKRREGIARLTIPKRLMPLIVETYISFISYTQKSIADSVYTGPFSM